MEKEDNVSIVDVLKLEMQCVRGNILMTVEEKNNKLIHLKRLAPKCKDWEGLDEPIQPKKSFWDTLKY